MLRRLVVVSLLGSVLAGTSLCAGAQQWFGQAPINRGNADLAGRITFLDTQDAAPISGKLTAWELFAMNTGDVTLEVFQPVSGGYELIGKNAVSVGTTGDVTIPVASADQISLQVGDLLGFSYDQTDRNPRVISFNGINGDGPELYTIPFDSNAGWYNLSVGTVIPLDGPNNTGFYSNGERRTYSLQAQVSPAAVPESGSAGLHLAVLLVLGAAFLYRHHKMCR